MGIVTLELIAAVASVGLFTVYLKREDIFEYINDIIENFVDYYKEKKSAKEREKIVDFLFENGDLNIDGLINDVQQNSETMEELYVDINKLQNIQNDAKKRKDIKRAIIEYAKNNEFIPEIYNLLLKNLRNIEILKEPTLLIQFDDFFWLDELAKDKRIGKDVQIKLHEKGYDSALAENENLDPAIRKDLIASMDNSLFNFDQLTSDEVIKIIDSCDEYYCLGDRTFFNKVCSSQHVSIDILGKIFKKYESALKNVFEENALPDLGKILEDLSNKIKAIYSAIGLLDVNEKVQNDENLKNKVGEFREKIKKYENNISETREKYIKSLENCREEENNSGEKYSKEKEVDYLKSLFIPKEESELDPR